MRKFMLFAALIAAAPVALVAAPKTPWTEIAGRDAADVALDAGRKPIETLTFFGIKRGDKVLDYEAGGGYYSEIMAKAVGPKGKVTAWLPNQFGKDEKAVAKWTALKARTPNVETLYQPFESFSAPANSYSFAMMHLSYHDVYWVSDKFKIGRQEPEQFLANIYKAMKPGGVVAVIDHAGAPGDTRATVDKLHRIDPAVVKADFLKAGFRFAGESQHLRVAADDYAKLVFDPAVRGKTDRFAMKFVKPK